MLKKDIYLQVYFDITKGNISLCSISSKQINYVTYVSRNSTYITYFLIKAIGIQVGRYNLEMTYLSTSYLRVIYAPTVQIIWLFVTIASTLNTNFGEYKSFLNSVQVPISANGGVHCNWKQVGLDLDVNGLVKLGRVQFRGHLTSLWQSACLFCFCVRQTRHPVFLILFATNR